MSKEDNCVISLPERLYSIGPDRAGIVDNRGFAFETWDGGGGDVFAAVGKFGPPGAVEKEGWVLFDLPSVINGGGRHPHTSLALNSLRKTIVNYGQKPSDQSEKTVDDSFFVSLGHLAYADLTALNGNELRISFAPYWRVLPGIEIRADINAYDWKKEIHNSVRFFEDEESQRKFVEIIIAFKRLTEAIRKDNQTQYVRGAR